MKKGDDAFNARDFAGMKAAHHPDMIAHITGNAQPVYGQRSGMLLCRRGRSASRSHGRPPGVT